MSKKFLFGVTLVAQLSLAHLPIVEAMYNTVVTEYLNQASKAWPILPVHIEEQILAWFASQPELIEGLIKQEKPFDACIHTHETNRSLLEKLEQAGMAKQLVSKSNYIFEITEFPEYVFKISGPKSRITGAIVANGFWPNKTYWDSAPDLSKLTPVITYQTASSIVMYSLYLEADKRTLWQHLYFPKTYVLRIGPDEQPLNDTNTVLVQEKVDLASPEQFKKLAQNLNHEQLAEVVRAIFECGLWTMDDHAPNLLFLSDGRLTVVDLEQPNVTNPLKGFYVHDPIQWHRNITAGVNDLKKWLNKYVEDQDRSKELIHMVDELAAK